jgi:hypothetical protein
MRPVESSEIVEGESPIGAVPFAELGTAAAIDLPSRQRMLEGHALVVAPPGGEIVEDAKLVAEVGEELARYLGGWFAADLSAFTRLHDSLATAELRAMAHGPGTTLTLESPRSSYYFVAFEEEGWQVQAAGESGDFHCVSFSRPLSAEDALGPGGHPRSLPSQRASDLVRAAAPEVDVDGLRDEAAAHPANLYDTYLSGRGVVLKAGIRLRVGAGGAPAGGATPCLDAVRLNLDLVG